MALALLSLLPMLAIFLAFQRYLIQGIASTGLK
jgi:alpha-1,4-digalacturonate transport system permease protein